MLLAFFCSFIIPDNVLMVELRMTSTILHWNEYLMRHLLATLQNFVQIRHQPTFFTLDLTMLLLQLFSLLINIFTAFCKCTYFNVTFCIKYFLISAIPENRTNQMKNGVYTLVHRPITTLTRQMAPAVWQGLEGLEPRPARSGMTSWISSTVWKAHFLSPSLFDVFCFRFRINIL